MKLITRLTSGLICTCVMYFVLKLRYDPFDHGQSNSVPARVRSIPWRYRSMHTPCFVEDWRKLVGDDPPFNVVREYNANNSTNVISFSVYGNNPKYFNRIAGHVKELPSVYPNWTSRVYIHNKSPANLTRMLIHSGAHVVIVNDPQARPGNSAGAFWRFLPLTEPGKNVFVRDSDDDLLRYKETVFDRMPPGKCFGGLWSSSFLKTYVKASTVIKKASCPAPFTVDHLQNFPIRTPYGADEYFLTTQVHVPPGKRAAFHTQILARIAFYFAPTKIPPCLGSSWYYSTAGTAALIAISGVLCVFVSTTSHRIFGALGGACYACISPIKTVFLVTIFNSWGSVFNCVVLVAATMAGLVYAALSSNAANASGYTLLNSSKIRKHAEQHGALLTLNILSSVALVCTLKYMLKAIPNAMIVTAIGAFSTYMALTHVPWLSRQSCSTFPFLLHRKLVLAVFGALAIGLVNVSLHQNSVGAYELLKCSIIPACMILDPKARKTWSMCATGVVTAALIAAGTIGQSHNVTPHGLAAGILASVCGAAERTIVRQIVDQGKFTALQILRAVLPWTMAVLIVLSFVL